ncbi:hypothetical protein C497_02012 [Halalkalicoccus jeotgali B3]|uniref:Uncharacterized protein n=1 Tax=Halalkalicoccus jeotgali (strain DSM 18796 / CECT 7217 / JCM 14584 / KCTC 4019 / B3) TaxID=795797 RepID=D8JBN5_HALJB|nr:hypothetical protein HacjB3_16691 [Halalkalicoccus jeotgali B3]ELY40819.1 hypothetical protein C497_02012 [Halalkalicoccus jeotgali B3]
MVHRPGKNMDSVPFHPAKRREKLRREGMMLGRDGERIGRQNSKRPAARKCDTRTVPSVGKPIFVTMRGVFEPMFPEKSSRSSTRFYPDFLQGNDIGNTLLESCQLAFEAVD